MSEEVLIVGAGPTGLVLALWLTRLGVGVRIVDRTAGPGTTSRAMAVQARTLELYRQLDLAAPAIAAGHRDPAINLWVKGRRRAHVAFDAAGADVTAFPFVLILPQDRHERLLVARLADLGVTVERGTELIGFTEGPDGVTSRLRGPDGREEEVASAVLAGCDGARSPVRHGLGIGFPGGTYEQTFYVADVEAAGPAADGEIHIDLESADFLAFFGYEPGHGRLIGAIRDERAGREGLTFEDVAPAAIRDMGLSVRTVNWFSTYKVHHRVAEHYRRGRVFLLGDAAHVHSPAGGQGMNTGIGDAVNLAWKLAMVLRGNAPDALLDSYERERIAFAERLVETTDRLFGLVSAEGAVADVLRTRLAPIAAATAFRLTGVRNFLFRTVSQTAIAYPESPLSRGRAGAIAGGDRLPYARGGFGDTHAALADPVWQVVVAGNPAPALSAWCGDAGLPLHAFPFAPGLERAGFAEGAVHLVRPDGHVGLVHPVQDPAALDAYRRDLGLVFG